MHSLGIIHRDISPGNFILADEKILYLIDFGAATSIREEKLKNKNVFRHKGLDSPEHSDISRVEDCEIKGYIVCDVDEYHVVAIADGVASVMHAELASKATIQAVSHFIDYYQYSETLAENLIEEFLDQLNEKILILSEKIGKTASTISILLWKNDRYCIANIGDSPMFQLTGNKLICLSEEHTVARAKLDIGDIPEKKDFHSLARYLGKPGVAGSQMANIKTGKINKGDIFLICSDGVSSELSEGQKIRYMKKDGDKAIKKIYEKCGKNPHMDNCTAIILKF